MYEVSFIVGDGAKLNTALKAANVDLGGINAATALNNRVFNCVGSPPARPSGNRPAYSNGARGPTPAITPFAVDSIGLTFPAQLLGKGAGDTARRYYLTDEVARLFMGLEVLAGRRPDLIMDATLGLEIRRLFEQNDPGNDRNDTDASKLYSAIDDYPRVAVVYAGGDDTGFSVTLDVLQRPIPVEVEHYLGS